MTTLGTVSRRRIHILPSFLSGERESVGQLSVERYVDPNYEPEPERERERERE